MSKKTTHKTVGNRIETKSKLKREAVAEVINEKLEKNVSLHIVSNGRFDYWNIVVRIIEIHNLYKSEFYGSTWTMNHENVTSFFHLMDSQKIQKATMLVGLYFMNREPDVYDTLRNGIQNRGGKIQALDVHSKIVLLSNENDFIVFEGSANFTANPRIEQFVLNNNKELYNFHKGWMDDCIKK